MIWKHPIETTIKKTGCLELQVYIFTFSVVRWHSSQPHLAQSNDHIRVFQRHCSLRMSELPSLGMKGWCLFGGFVCVCDANFVVQTLTWLSELDVYRKFLRVERRNHIIIQIFLGSLHVCRAEGGLMLWGAFKKNVQKQTGIRPQNLGFNTIFWEECLAFRGYSWIWGERYRKKIARSGFTHTHTQLYSTTFGEVVGACLITPSTLNVNTKKYNKHGVWKSSNSCLEYC